MLNQGLFSSEKQDWCTPQQFFDELDAEFHFVLDAAATHQNSKCKRCFTPEDDGLIQNWDMGGGGILQPSLWKRDRFVGQESV